MALANGKLLVLLFLIAQAVAALGAFNRFSSAPLLCAFLILGYPYFAGSALPAKVPILLTLITEAFAFGVGLRVYLRLRCIDPELVKRFAGPAVGTAILGAAVAHLLPLSVLLSAWTLLLLGVVVAWWQAPAEGELGLSDGRGSQDSLLVKRLVTADGMTYVYACARQGVGFLLTAVGAFITGLTAFGLGEVETANFVVCCRIPTRVAVGTGLAIALPAVLAAVGTHLALFSVHGGLHLPLPLVAVTSLGAVVGSALGRRVARLVPCAIAATRLVYIFLAVSAVGVFALAVVKPF
jgi:uncharacterized membrane protein YfcA